MVTILFMLRLANTEYMEMLHTSDHGLTTLFLIMVEPSTVMVSKSYLSLEILPWAVLKHHIMIE